MKTERFAIIYFDAAGVSFVEHDLTPRESAIIHEAAADARRKLESYTDRQFIKPNGEPAKPGEVVTVEFKTDFPLTPEETSNGLRIVHDYGIEGCQNFCFCGHGLVDKHYIYHSHLNPYKTNINIAECLVKTCNCKQGRKIIVKGTEEITAENREYFRGFGKFR